MLKKVWQSRLLALVLVPTLMNLATESVRAEAAISEDDLTVTRGLRWGASGLPYNQAADIKDSLINAVVGKMVPDRHSISPNQGGGGFLQSLFRGGQLHTPSPGSIIFVSFWGSKIEGCFVEMVIQYAPANGNADLEGIYPTKLEMGIAGQPIALPPQPNAKKTAFKQDYTYTFTKDGKEYEGSSTWYLTRNLFLVDANIATILSNAPAQEVRTRLTFADGSKIIVPIGAGTVKKWKEAYSFNPTCTNMNKSAPQEGKRNSHHRLDRHQQIPYTKPNQSP